MGEIKNQFLILIVFALGFSCTEPYDINITDYEDALVVHGLITNNVGPYKVVLSRTLPIDPVIQEFYRTVDGDYYNFERYAIVTICDINGNIVILDEISPGIYITDPSFRAEIGNQYQLKIKTIRGVEFESNYVSLNEGIGIENIYTEYKEHYDFEQHKYVAGIDIKVDTESWEEQNGNFFLKWDYEETWEIGQKWNEIELIDNVYDYNLDRTQVSCWVYDYSFDIVIDDASNYSSNKLKGKTILHLDKENPKPFYGYSILIKQYTINESVYEFWEMLKETNLDNGNLFDKLPYNAESNIECCNGDSKVYGYFDASSVSEERIFLKSPVNDVVFRDYNSECIRYSTPTFLFIGLPNVYAILMDLIETTYTKQKYCVDCSIVSTTKQKPDFWIF